MGLPDKTTLCLPKLTTLEERMAHMDQQKKMWLFHQIQEPPFIPKELRDRTAFTGSMILTTLPSAVLQSFLQGLLEVMALAVPTQALSLHLLGRW